MNRCNDSANTTRASDGKDRRGPECGSTQRPLSMVISPDVAPRSHQRRWSIDLSKFRNSNIIILRKKKKEPQLPQRGVSLLQPDMVTHPSSKRYSCPPMGTWGYSSSSSSSISSTSSSSSSPPPVKTSAITGHDPLGWKLRPKSSANSSKTRTNRLSLHIALPMIPDPESPKPESSPTAKPALIPKPIRRHHSDTSALISSRGAPPPVVTLEDLRAAKLLPVSPSDGSDDVFVESAKEEEQETDRPRKMPPPVPEKTAVAKQIAQLIASSHQRWRAKTKQDPGMTKLQPKTPVAGQ